MSAVLGLDRSSAQVGNVGACKGLTDSERDELVVLDTSTTKNVSHLLACKDLRNDAAEGAM